MTADLIVAGRLADFICTWRHADPGEGLLHEAKRLLLNQLKASAEASQQPAGMRWLAQVARAAPAERRRVRAHLWWSGITVTPERAALHNGQLLGLLDFGDTHLPTRGQFTAGLLPNLLAQAEAGGHGGERTLTALVVGLEVAIAGAMLAAGKPGAPPQDAATPLRLGAVAAQCTLLGLDREATTATLNDICAVWPVAPALAEAALEGLGERWRMKGIAMHCRPLPVSALAPVDAVLALRPLAGQRTLKRMMLSLSPQAWDLANGDEGDLRDALAASWLLGQFTAEERQPACRNHPSTRALRERVELRPEASITGIEACALSVEFEDGSREHIEVHAFLGSPRQALSDAQLSELFRSAADDLVLPRRSGEILQALWGLNRAAEVRPLMALLCTPV